MTKRTQIGARKFDLNETVKYAGVNWKVVGFKKDSSKHLHYRIKLNKSTLVLTKRADRGIS